MELRRMLGSCGNTIDPVIDLLQDAHEYIGDSFILYVTYMTSNAPMFTETSKRTTRPRIVVNDIWSMNAQRFLGYDAVYHQCYHHNLPLIELCGVSKPAIMEELYEYRNKMLKTASAQHRTGIIGKAYDPIKDAYIFFEEKCKPEQKSKTNAIKDTN